MRVLHVAASLSPEWGGPVPVVRSLAARQAAAGLDVVVLATASRRERETPPLIPGVQVEMFPRDWLACAWTAHSRALARRLRSAVPAADVVHVHEIWHHPHAVACREAHRVGRPYVITPHGALDPWPLRHKRVRKSIYAAIAEKRHMEHAALIHALTEDEREAVRAFGVDAVADVIPNGVELEGFAQLPPPESFERDHPEVRAKVVLLFMGRIHPKKGLDLLAAAYGKVAHTVPDVHLVIAGPDEDGYRRTVERQFAAVGVTGQVTFTGMLSGEKKLSALSRADVFVLPSYSEGFSMAVLEALACRLPVIITRECHFPDVQTCGAGIVINPDVEDLAAAMERLLGDRETRSEMAYRARHLVETKYTWDRVIERMIDMYKRVAY